MKKIINFSFKRKNLIIISCVIVAAVLLILLFCFVIRPWLVNEINDIISNTSPPLPTE